MPSISQKFKKDAEDLFLSKGPDYCLNILEKYYKEKIFPKDKQRLMSRLASAWNTTIRWKIIMAIKLLSLLIPS